MLPEVCAPYDCCHAGAYRVIPELDVARGARVHLHDGQRPSRAKNSTRLGQDLLAPGVTRFTRSKTPVRGTSVRPTPRYTPLHAVLVVGDKRGDHSIYCTSKNDLAVSRCKLDSKQDGRCWRLRSESTPGVLPQFSINTF